VMQDISGKRNGRLVAVRHVGTAPDGHANWLCKCDCGGSKIVQSNNLKKGGVGSCGCLSKEANTKRFKENGAWNDGKSYAINNGERCYKTRHSWSKAVIRHYGNKCQDCGWDKGRCDAHHRVPKAKGGKHTIANGTVVCPNCHRIRHERGEKD